MSSSNGTTLPARAEQPHEPTHLHRGTWNADMRRTLRARYAEAREHRQLHELAAQLGVDLYQLYSQAHRLGLSREIRRR